MIGSDVCSVNFPQYRCIFDCFYLSFRLICSFSMHPPQFQHRLLDIATQPASLHRAAFLAEDLSIFEWSSAGGATPVNIHLPFPSADTSTNAASNSSLFEQHQSLLPSPPKPHLTWGSHPRSLWLSHHSHLYHLDLRQKTAAAAIPVSTGMWPKGLLLPQAGGPASGASLLLENQRPVVGPVARHPFDENLLFVSADACLLALDLRYTVCLHVDGVSPFHKLGSLLLS